MGQIDYWIQIENHAWDVCPNGDDRMSGQSAKQLNPSVPAPGNQSLVSPVTNVATTRYMNRPLAQEALILRRYTANWAAPDDRKVNPWDLNEPDPSDLGTMGTIPGATIECDLALADSVVIHFRNMDTRSVATEKRTHSLHPHGFVFAPTSDGAYPLTPPDTSQPIPAGEQAAWASVGVTNGFKQGDRVPPGGTFTYTWNTIGWPTTAGVWLYHDHSICDDENIGLGAIGIVVIHNSNDPLDVVSPDLPGNSQTGSPLDTFCFPFPFNSRILPTQIAQLERLAGSVGAGMPGMTGRMPGMTATAQRARARQRGRQSTARVAPGPQSPLVLRLGDLVLEPDAKFLRWIRWCFSFFKPPPERARYLLLFHTLRDAQMCINGRKYLGNTPTVVAGPTTFMRFGVVGMGSDFHTFHIHGHRWAVLGPSGTTPPQIQGSIENSPVSQFEDTRTFGPANSFNFGIDEGQGFMRAQPGAAVGEWHMHCHVLMHMMDGMMGSLLVVNGGEPFTGLPVGVPCPADAPPPMGGDAVVQVQFPNFTPTPAPVTAGHTVTWQNLDNFAHTISADDLSFDMPLPASGSVSRMFMNVGNVPYHCNIHPQMKSTIAVNP